MHLFIAREALDPHLEKTKPLLSAKASMGVKLKTIFQIIGYYVPWYIKLWLPVGIPIKKIHPVLGRHMRYVRRTSKRLAREIIHQMMRHQKKLESRQTVLNRIVDIGTELFAISTACSYAEHLIKNESEKENAIELADLFCRTARERVASLFKDAHCNQDRLNVSVAKNLMSQKYEWLENDIIK